MQTAGSAACFTLTMTSGSLYFHAPFCKRKCGYCHFYVTRDDEAAKDLWVEGILAELEQKKIEEPTSIYFGGGTPALLGPDRIQAVLATLPMAEEITLEANPESLTDLERWRAIGINRLSLGVQSFSDQVLPTLDRDHSAEQAERIIYAARDAGFDNITIDLMIDLPGLTIETWQQSLDRAVELPITHLSLYNLTIEPGTAFHRRGVKTPDTSTEFLDRAVKTLEDAGLARYEISAFGRPSLHNIGYWRGRPFYGLGPSAFSDWNGRRFRNVANLRQWHAKVMGGEDAADFSEELSPGRRQRELLVIGLRMLEGVPYIETPDTLRLIGDDLLQRRGERLQLTERGLLFYDTVAAELI